MPMCTMATRSRWGKSGRVGSHWRQSGKSAAIGANAMSETESMLGAHIFIVTIFDETILGELFCVHENEHGLHVVIRHHLENGHKTFTWMKASIIAEVTVLEGPQFAAADEVLPPLSIKRRGWICRKVTHGWQRREDYCISRRQKELRRREACEAELKIHEAEQPQQQQPWVCQLLSR